MNVSREELAKWVEGSYEIALAHGFHDKVLSVPRMLMLIFTEVSEVVEADRKRLRANLSKFDIELSKDNTDDGFEWSFGIYIKDSVEDELADVIIRICDTCATLDIPPHIVGGAEEDFRNIFGSDTLCEKCFYLCQILGRIDETLLEGFGDDSDSVEHGLGSALTFVLCMCEDMGIDIKRHVELKMHYNELRPAKHGKAY